MKTLLLTLSVTLLFAFAQPAGDKTVYQFTMDSITGEAVPLAQYKGKVLLIVNTASKCGNTPQYADLEKFYKEYKDKGFEILGFPANNFMGQEPGSDEEIMTFCEKNYGVTFPMFSKISVKGNDQHPLYQFLTDKEQNGVVDGEVRWNFQKYLINRNGEVVLSISPRTSIYDADVVAAIKAELEKK